MRNLCSLFAFILLITISSHVQCQDANKTTTIIIIRHAEKDTGNNPPLSNVGRLRAEKLSTRFKAIRPDEIFSTEYTRTEQTVQPWAEKLGLEIKHYDPKNLPEFAEYLSNAVGKNIIVVGHSNTNPRLVNLLTKEDRFDNLVDADYETIFQVTIKKKRPKVKVIKFNE